MSRTRAAAASLALLALSAFAFTDKDVASIIARRHYGAFQKPVKSAAPEIQSPWVRNPIDAFILEALQENKLSPSEALDREHLLRRVTFDLTGLPAEPGEIDAFLLDKSPEAYQKVVDRLLASPHYGE